MFVSKQQQVQQLLLWGLALPIVACINLRVRVQLVQQGGLIEAAAASASSSAGRAGLVGGAWAVTTVADGNRDEEEAEPEDEEDEGDGHSEVSSSYGATTLGDLVSFFKAFRGADQAFHHLRSTRHSDDAPPLVEEAWTQSRPPAKPTCWRPVVEFCAPASRSTDLLSCRRHPGMQQGACEWSKSKQTAIDEDPPVDCAMATALGPRRQSLSPLHLRHCGHVNPAPY
eukprot:CAMPEP_0194776628 /NCGR_PEP_ID=MMETSP0323_2-20130528/63599_2 /TAXON_ID=2866 ORGANISM="Crypthecodinium cohnii, Strain Seligo" /NCGR_SAMPLE_ID=MMETSP0323_2 /ASSEMBLY_ACC=CAM_ASM_000346 /LENGTH=226 /DNA_ID=CAMNT_0039713107 /DNA_START=85 /DNA_END=765 /DNA_ORIENTATION=-